MKATIISSVAVIFAAIGLNSCGTLDVRSFGIEENEKESKFQAGTIDIATFKPIVWNTISDELKPNFGVKNAKELLGEVAPIVGGDDYRASQRLAAQLAANLAGPELDKTVTSNSTSNIDATGLETETESNSINSTRSQSTPDAITLSPSALASLIGSPGALNEASGSYGFDPRQKYKAAAGLFQNIVFLDRYLDQPLDEDGKTALLIRSQITINPFSRQQPYDVYSNLSFKVTDKDDAPVAYRIFPLIIADNLERTNTRRIAESLQSIQSSLGGRQGLFSLGGRVDSALDKLRTLVGSDLNSLITYTQPNDSELMVRFAAPFDAKSGYSMRARTYDVTFVIVADVGQRTLYNNENTSLNMEVRAENVLRHARTGNALPNISEADINHLQSRVTKFMEIVSTPLVTSGHVSPPFTPKKIVHDVIYGSDAVSDARIKIFDDPTRYPNYYEPQIRESLQRARVSRINSFSKIELPQEDYELPRGQTPTLLDDGKATTVQLVGKSRPSARKMIAELNFTPTPSPTPPTPSPTPPTPGAVIPPNQKEYGPFQHTGMSFSDNIYQFKFPSMSALGIDLAKGNLELKLEYNSAKFQTYTPRVLKASKAPTRETSFKVTQFSKSFTEGVGSNGAHARIVVAAKSKTGVANDVKAFRLTITGGTLAKLNQLNKDGTVNTSAGIVMDISKNAAVFKTAGAAYDIILKGAKVPVNTEITCKIEGLNSSGKAIKQEEISIKYVTKPATGAAAGK